MKTVLLCSYREWSDSICKEIQYKFKNDDVVFTLCNTSKKFSYLISKNNYDLIFFLGWSSIISNEVVEKNLCICLHPSMLPKYRGGSPIQHQIISGETTSAVTLFVMDQGIDTGPILFQENFSIENCELNDIFESIISLGIQGCSKIIKDLIEGISLNPIHQNNSESSFFKRRTNDMSEITIEDFSKYSAKEIYNKIRALQDPYPNAFIRCKDNTILYLIKSKHGEF